MAIEAPQKCSQINKYLSYFCHNNIMPQEHGNITRGSIDFKILKNTRMQMINKFNIKNKPELLEEFYNNKNNIKDKLNTKSIITDQLVLTTIQLKDERMVEPIINHLNKNKLEAAYMINNHQTFHSTYQSDKITQNKQQNYYITKYANVS